MPEICGIDHIYITVSDMRRSEIFYDLAMGVLGFRKKSLSIAGDVHAHYFNRHFGYVLRPAKSTTGYDAYSPGLHHLCFRVDSQSDVASVARALRAAGVDATSPRNYSEYAPDYYATFFSDPDGIRLEVTNYRQERRERHDRWNELEA